MPKEKKSLPSGDGEPRQPVIALTRGLDILQCFSVSRPQLGSAELARMTGLPQPTVWRLCQTLVHSGFLLPTANGQRLQLGTAALSLGLTATATFDGLQVVRPRMQAIADRYRAAVSIAACERQQMVYLERRTAEVILGTNLQRGSRLPIHKCTLGWAYLVALPDKARTQLIDRLRKDYPDDAASITELAVSKLEQYRTQGYVLQRGLVHREIVALAIPVLSPSGGQPLAINCSCDIDTTSSEELQNEIAPQLRALADILEASLLQEASAGTGNWLERTR